MRYLALKKRKDIEKAMAFYGVILGAYILIGVTSGASPLAWAFSSVEAQTLYGYAVSTFGLTHALGVWVNGRWRYSPLLRVFGMGGHTGALAVLANIGLLQWNTAGITYLMLYVCFALGLSAALDDAIHALKGAPKWTA